MGTSSPVSSISSSSLLDADEFNLKQIQEQAWAQLEEIPATLPEAIQRLDAPLLELRTALHQSEGTVGLQEALEHLFMESLILLKPVGLDPQQALLRALKRMVESNRHSQARVFRVFDERVELWIGNQYRGGWPLFSHEDYKACRRLAKEMGCVLEEHDQAISQLTLFD